MKEKIQKWGRVSNRVGKGSKHRRREEGQCQSCWIKHQEILSYIYLKQYTIHTGISINVNRYVCVCLDTLKKKCDFAWVMILWPLSIFCGNLGNVSSFQLKIFSRWLCFLSLYKNVSIDALRLLMFKRGERRTTSLNHNSQRQRHRGIQTMFFSFSCQCRN